MEGLLADEVDVSIAQSVSVELQGRTLDISNYNGNIDIKGISGDITEITFTLRGTGLSESDAAEARDQISIEQIIEDDAVKFIVESGNTKDTSVDILIRMPYMAVTYLRLANGDILIDDISAEMDVSTSNGNVLITDAQSSINATSQNGNIDAEMLIFPSGTEIKLVSNAGNILLRLPKTVSATAQLKTVNGNIQILGITPSSGNIAETGTGAIFNGAFGDASGSVSANTTNGDITIRNN